jgi:hypothetical protein
MSPIARRWPFGAVVAVLGLVGLALWQRPANPPPQPGAAHTSPPAVPRHLAGAEGERLPEGLPDAPPGKPAPEVPIVEGDAGIDGESMGGTWQVVDMETVRAALPDNLYWHLSQPTTDEQVIEERARERARWNVEYGKVLSGTGTEEEIRAYYDYKSRLYGDYIEFSTHLLDHYESELPPRDVALLQFARRLHQARLEEVPRKLEEAFERKRAQDAARAAWLADQAAFEADTAAQADGQ